MTLPIAPEFFLGLFLASLRIGVVLLFLPILGGEFLPTRIRVLFAFAIGLLVAPPVLDQVPTNGVALAQALTREFMIGATIGFFCRLFLLAPTLAGDMIAQELGIRMAQEVDPNTRIPTTPIGRLYEIVFFLFFLITNGHHDVFRALGRSFQTLPLGGDTIPGSVAGAANGLALCLRHALMIAIPLFSVLLVLSFVLALLSKSVPQINIMNFGFGARLLGGFLLSSLLFPLVQRPLVGLMDAFRSSLVQLVGG